MDRQAGEAVETGAAISSGPKEPNMHPRRRSTLSPDDRSSRPAKPLPPDTNWHVFEIRADLANRVWAGVAVDGSWNPMTNVPLARIYQPGWGSDLSLILTAESENAYPGSTNPIVTQWTTQFKDPKLYRLD